MFRISRGSAAIIVMTTGLLAGCAADGGADVGNTSSIADQKSARVDPACVTLAAQIDQLNKEGTPDRLAQASSGKTATVPVKRESLAKQAQLNKANADFRGRCSTITPKPVQQATVAPVAVPATPVAPSVVAAGAGGPVAQAAAVEARPARVKAEPRSALEEALAGETRGQ